MADACPTAPQAPDASSAPPRRRHYITPNTHRSQWPLLQKQFLALLETVGRKWPLALELSESVIAWPDIWMPDGSVVEYRVPTQELRAWHRGLMAGELKADPAFVEAFKRSQRNGVEYEIELATIANAKAAAKQAREVEDGTFNIKRSSLLQHTNNATGFLYTQLRNADRLSQQPQQQTVRIGKLTISPPKQLAAGKKAKAIKKPADAVVGEFRELPAGG